MEGLGRRFFFGFSGEDVCGRFFFVEWRRGEVVLHFFVKKRVVVFDFVLSTCVSDCGSVYNSSFRPPVRRGILSLVSDSRLAFLMVPPPPVPAR